MRRLLGLEGVSTGAVLAVLGVCLVTPLVHWFALDPEVPHITYVQISLMQAPGPGSDPAEYVYYYLLPPVHMLMKWVYTQPAAFVLANWATHAVFNLLVFRLAIRGAMRAGLGGRGFAPWIVAVMAVVVLYPLGLALGLGGQGTTLIPHDSYHEFSFRIFFWLLALIAYILVLEGRLGAALIAVALGCYMHPSAGVVGFGLLSLIVLWRLRAGWDGRLVVTWALAAVLGALPTLAKQVLLELPPELMAGLNFGDWYSQLIKDEADDFSVLYQFAHRRAVLAAIFVTLGGTLGLYAWLVPGFRRHLSFWAALAIPVLYLLLALTEYVFCVVYPTFPVYPISALTLGYRFLSYAFLPFVVLGAGVAAVILARVWDWLAQSKTIPVMTGAAAPAAIAAAVVAAVWAGFLALGARNGDLQTAAAYTGWAFRAGSVPGIEAYFLAARSAGADKYFQPAVYETAAPMKTYPGERDVFAIARADRDQPARTRIAAFEPVRGLDAFVALVETVRREIPEAATPNAAGLYLPPYLRHFRDALPRHKIFFQEHPDQHLSLISPRFSRFWLERMDDLLGGTYEDMPSKDSGLLYTAMRNAYLAIDAAKIARLRAKYPSYRYFVTELNHRLPFGRIAETGAFVIYDLESPAGS